MNYKLIDFSLHGDQRGKLVALESNKDIPFDIKSVYYMFGIVVKIIKINSVNRKYLLKNEIKIEII